MQNTTAPSQDALVVAKKAIADKDWGLARELLEPLVEHKSGSVASFFLARVAFSEGEYDNAARLLDKFQADRPHHTGAIILQARICLALGEFENAKTQAASVLENSPDHVMAAKVLHQAEVAISRIQAIPIIAEIDAAYLETRQIKPAPELRAAAEELSKFIPDKNWADDKVEATIAYFHFASDLDEALRNYDPHLIDVSVRHAYITWPKRIQHLVKGKSVIDVGCGFGGFGMGFLVAGADQYTGLDPVMKLDSTSAKNKRTRTWADMGVTPREIAAKMPAVRLFECIAEDMPVKETFDTIALHNVTEHLMQLDLVFQGLVGLCKPDTSIVYLHHNFYCWNGHHFSPSRPDQLDLSDPQHAKIHDWGHINLVSSLPDDHYWKTHLNRVRLDEIHAITEKYFNIEIWDEIPSLKATTDRLTPELVDRARQAVPDLTKREMLTNVVYCVARPKGTTPKAP